MSYRSLTTFLRVGGLMFDREKAMTDAIDAIVRLDFTQLVVLNAHLAEHMFNVLQAAQVKSARQAGKYEL